MKSLAMILFASAGLIWPGPARAQDEAAIDRGHRFVEGHCARCHAIGAAGESTHPKAPPFRTLGQRYPIEDLAESLAEGIVVGHTDMPRFTLAADDISDVLAYLKSVQVPADK